MLSSDDKRNAKISRLNASGTHCCAIQEYEAFHQLVYAFEKVCYIYFLFVLNEIIVLEKKLNKNLFENKILLEFQPTKISSVRHNN